MADTQVLGTCVFGREGSSPFSRTHILKLHTRLKSMAKQSVAKTKKMAAEAKRSGAARRAEKKLRDELSTTKNDPAIERYEAVDGDWREIGLAAPARRALIDDGLFTLR